MFDFFYSLNPIVQALLAGIFAYFFTCLGAALVLFFKRINKTLMDAMLALSAGIMLSASFFSLLLPALTKAEELNYIVWLVVSSCFFSGGLFIFLTEKILSRNSVLSNFRRCVVLFTSITLHNIPEGLVVGVAFGLCYINGSSLIAALILTLGIAIQNFPEGAAISLPFRRENLSRNKSFLMGCLSGLVEPISSVIGLLLVLKIQTLLPIIMSFTAGAMIYVIIKELIPEAQTNKNTGLISLLTMIGFIIMMILELILD